MDNINEQLTKLTTLPLNFLDSLTNIITYCIASTIQSSTENIVEINLNIGILKVLKSDEGYKFKFIPSQKLVNEIKNGNSIDKLLNNFENKFKDSLEFFYRNVL